VLWWNCIDVSAKHAVRIFRVEASYFNPEMKSAGSAKIPVNFYHTTWPYMPEENTVGRQHRVKPKYTNNKQT
jgi:hypothetical protein